MNKFTQQLVMDELGRFLKAYYRLDDLSDADIAIRPGEEGVKYSDYARPGTVYVSFEGPMYEDMNDGNYNPLNDTYSWDFVNKLDEWMADRNLWYEQGNAWNLNVMEKE